MKCPFRKNTSYLASETALEGYYPTDWKVIEAFEDCIGEECAAFGSWTRYNYVSFDKGEFKEPYEKKFCKLCEK